MCVRKDKVVRTRLQHRISTHGHPRTLPSHFSNHVYSGVNAM